VAELCQLKRQKRERKKHKKRATKIRVENVGKAEDQFQSDNYLPGGFKNSLDPTLYLTQSESHYQFHAIANIRPMQS
jgi:hypothetical protein